MKNLKRSSNGFWPMRMLFLVLAARSGAGAAGSEGYFPQDWSSLPAGTPSGGRVGLRLELAWLDRAETPC